MTEKELHQILDSKAVPYPTGQLHLIETHISWVLLGDTMVYKIKKPVKLSFLDFSNIIQRKYRCEQEVKLNRRLAPAMYLDVLPVYKTDNGTAIGKGPGVVIDYAVWMKRMDNARQLDLLLQEGSVKIESIIALADKIVSFHRHAPVIPEGHSWQVLFREYRDIEAVRPFMEKQFGNTTGQLLGQSSEWALRFLKGVAKRIEERNRAGFVVDGHGDLHCRNIFLLEDPVVFDCIEFNDEFRKLDMLSEIAFLCMDLERFGRKDLSDTFSDRYFSQIHCLENETDRLLYLFYKMYRANVRIKVHAIRAQEVDMTKAMVEGELRMIRTYLSVFKSYYQLLGSQNGK